MRSNLRYLIDDWEGHLSRQGKSQATRRSYRSTVDKLVDWMGDRDADQLTRRDVERFLDQYMNLSRATVAQRMAAIASFTRYLYETGETADDVAEKLPRPRRVPPEDLDVVTVTADDVRRMFDACETWAELLALSLAAYAGARRNALSGLRWRDVDLARGLLRFHEKGSKVIVKPIADELREILVRYSADQLEQHPDDYVIPNLRPAGVRRAERDDRVVWNIIRAVARRAGVRAHVHSLRAAFAVHFIESGTGDAFQLKDLLGHRRMETTDVYLRRLNRDRQMESVRALSWGPRPDFVLQAKAVEAHTGFEPVLPPKADESTHSHVTALVTAEIDELVERVRATARARHSAPTKQTK